MSLTRLNDCYREVRDFNSYAILKVDDVTKGLPSNFRYKRVSEKCKTICDDLNGKVNLPERLNLIESIDLSHNRKLIVFLRGIVGICTLPIGGILGVKIAIVALEVIGTLFNHDPFTSHLFRQFTMSITPPIVLSIPFIHIYAMNRIFKWGTEQLLVIYNRTQLEELLINKKQQTQTAFDEISGKITALQEEGDKKEALLLVQKYLKDKLALYGTLIPRNGLAQDTVGMQALA